MLPLVWAWTEWVCIVAGKCLVGPPPLPALRRCWGKVLVCHKGLGVVCSACQVLMFVNRRLWAGLPAGESLGAIGLSVIPGWTTPSGAVSHSSALLGLISSPSCPRVVPHLVCVLFPYPIHLPPSCSPLSPHLFFCPFTPSRLSS